MTSRYWIAAAAIPLALSACTKMDDGDSGEDSGFEMSINMDDEAEDGINSGDEREGKFSIKADGFALDVDLPSFTLDSDDFDLNNVALYPGTKVTGLNVEDIDGEGGKVTVSFVSPAGAEKLASWFEQKMKAEDFVVAKNGNNLSGNTDEGDPFFLKLTEKSSDETSGKLEFSEK